MDLFRDARSDAPGENLSVAEGWRGGLIVAFWNRSGDSIGWGSAGRNAGGEHLWASTLGRFRLRAARLGGGHVAARHLAPSNVGAPPEYRRSCCQPTWR